MTLGKRIRYFRLRRGMSQMQLGLMLGFPDSNANIRIGQYECNSRSPKNERLNDFAEALHISPLALTVPNISNLDELMHLLFMLEDEFGLKISCTRKGEVFLSFKSLFRISPRASGLHLFRQILPKPSLIHKVLPAVLASSDEKSDCAIRTRGDSKQALSPPMKSRAIYCISCSWNGLMKRSFFLPVSVQSRITTNGGIPIHTRPLQSLAKNTGLED